MYVHNVDPVILKINLGFITLPLRYYGLFFGTGILTAFFISRSFFRKLHYDDRIIDKLLIYLVVTIVLMAHFVHMLFYEPQALTQFKFHRWIAVGTGLASHGGFLGGLLGLYLFIKFNPQFKKPYLHYADLLFVGGAVFPMFVRLGNWFNSEIYGRTTDVPWGVIFQRRGETLPRHPSQLYEAIVGITIFFIIYLFYKKNYRRVKDGTITIMFMVLYFTTRFFLEYFKEYQFLSKSFPLTMGQLLSIPIVLLGLYLLFVKKYYKLLDEDKIIAPMILDEAGKNIIPMRVDKDGNLILIEENKEEKKVELKKEKILKPKKAPEFKKKTKKKK